MIVPLLVGAFTVFPSTGPATASYSAAGSGPASAAADPTCPDVMVIGARGSGEGADSPANGMGSEVTTFYDALTARLKGKLTFDSRHVRYTAAAVDVLFPTPAEVARIKAARSNAAKLAVLADIASTYKAGHLDLFTASIDEGTATAFDELTIQAARCPTARFVLAGYSQGAMVMHQLLLRLEDQGDASLLGRIANTVFIADGDKKKATAALTFGTASPDSEGVRSFFSTGERDIPSNMAPSTYDICDKGDIVCDFSLQTLTRVDQAKKVHTTYTDSHVVTLVGRLVGAHLLADVFVTTTSLPAGQVGVPYAGTLAGTGIAPLHWSATTALPAGLTLSADGLVSGTPTASGTAYIDVLLTDANGRTAAATVSMTIDPGIAPQPPTTGTWAATSPPVPVGAVQVSLQGVSCTSPTACTAVGSYTHGSSASAFPLVETLSGGVWTPTTPPLPADAIGSPQLSGVSCASPTACTAVGSYSAASGGQSALVETLAGGVWTPTSPPLPPDSVEPSSVFLLGVSCVSASACTAVGEYFGANFGALPLVETLAGGVWTPSSTPLPAGNVGDVALSGVSCVSATACVAVGGSTGGLPLVETLAGAVWTPTVPAAPTFSSSRLQAVSCVSATACTATGGFGGYSGPPLVETLAGGVWTATRPPLPTDFVSNGYSILYGVSCPSSSVCTAVGGYLATTGVNVGHDRPLAETLEGDAETPTSPPLLPAASGNATLTDVSCASATTCTSVGFYQDGSELALVETLTTG